MMYSVTKHLQLGLLFQELTMWRYRRINLIIQRFIQRYAGLQRGSQHLINVIQLTANNDE